MVRPSAPELAAAMTHDALKGNVYTADGQLWCPDCNQLCPCKCCGSVWAAAAADLSAPAVRQLPHEAGVEYRSSG